MAFISTFLMKNKQLNTSLSQEKEHTNTLNLIYFFPSSAPCGQLTGNPPFLFLHLKHKPIGQNWQIIT